MLYAHTSIPRDRIYPDVLQHFPNGEDPSPRGKGRVSQIDFLSQELALLQKLHLIHHGNVIHRSL